MSEVFCTRCGYEVDPQHSGCGRADCPYRDPELPIEHVPGHHEIAEDVTEEKPREESRREKFGKWEEYGREIDAGENPKRPQPPPPWKKH